MGIFEFVKDYNGLDDIAELRRDLFIKDITVSYDREVVDGSRRVIFTHSKGIRHKNTDEFMEECNGLILKAPSWEPVCIPIPFPKSYFDRQKANALLPQYDIYETSDGTIINLYFYNDNWVISTTRGIDVGDLAFSKITYKNILEECFQKCDINYESFLTKLEPTRSYTFVFKHPDMHPFREGQQEDLYKLTFIQSVDLQTKEVTRISPFEEIPSQKKVENVKDFRQLFNIVKNAYATYDNTGEVCYGFVAFSRTPQEDYSMLLIESELLNYIRKLWYSAEYKNYSEENDFDRIKTILLSSFLDDKKYQIFMRLFPQYRSEFDNMSSKENKLAKQIYLYISGKDSQNANVKTQILFILASQVKKLIDVATHSRPIQKITEIIHNPDNFFVYYKYFFE